MENEALIFIPDISGFTKFVTETEINHSQHIIKELIEVIVKSLNPEIIVSEIEGDAVLAYQLGNPPSYNKLKELAEKVFLNFHSQLKIIERDNVCSCGACTGASNLTLKFISHFGKLKEVEVANFKKIIGSDVILAHRLLKNNVPLNEYLLFTEQFLNTQKNDSFVDKTNLVTNIEEYDNFGKVETKYLDFSPLINKIPSYPKIDRITEGTVSDSIYVFVKAPIDFVHSKLINTKGKINWVKDITKINDNNAINRINAVHICEFDKMNLQLTTKTSQVINDEYFFQEEAEIRTDVKFINDFHLTKIDNTTKVEYKILYDAAKGKSFLQGFVNKFKFGMIIKSMMSAQKVNLYNFKNYCKREFEIQQTTLEN